MLYSQKFRQLAMQEIVGYLRMKKFATLKEIMRDLDYGYYFAKGLLQEMVAVGLVKMRALTGSGRIRLYYLPEYEEAVNKFLSASYKRRGSQYILYVKFSADDFARIAAAAARRNITPKAFVKLVALEVAKGDDVHGEGQD